ncbi:MAG: M48 family metalloprotease [Chloroflexi bacterium]|nr:M48 family metalloprotease [Chloroflexota bacterium]
MLNSYHTAVIATAIALALIGGYLHLMLLRRMRFPARNPLLPYAIILLSPAIILGFIVAGHCYSVISEWDGHIYDDHSIALMLLVGQGLIVVGSLALALGRLIFSYLLIWRYPQISDPTLIGLVQNLSSRFGVPCPTLRLYPHSHPLVLLCGTRSLGPMSILISDWVLANLDQEELEAALAHELAHIQRRDNLLGGIATFWQEAFFYLPPVRKVYLAWQKEREFDCDEQAAYVTSPLALASVLTKVWDHAIRSRRAQNPLPSTRISSLWTSAVSMEERIQRLLTLSVESAGNKGQFGAWFSWGSVATVLVVQLALAALVVSRFCWGAIAQLRV